MKTKTIIMCLTGAVIIMCLIMMFRTSPRFVLSIQSFDVNTSKITVGGGSDICFEQIPHDFMEVEDKDGYFEWKVNDVHRRNDSLMYYTINNINPNFHRLEEGQISIQLPAQSDRPAQTLTIPIDEIKGLLKGPESKYVLLRTLLQMRDTRDTTIDYTSIKQLRSCLARKTKKSPWGIVILDKYTTLVTPDGNRITYAMNGRTDSIEGAKAPANTFKVQFYRMSNYTIMPEDIDDDMFHIGRMHYLAKPVLVTTKWGAGHAMVTEAGNGLHVAFPKALTYAERVDSLRSYAKGTSRLLTYQQSDGSFPVSHNLLLPFYSNAISQDVCNLRITDDSLGVFLGTGSIKLITNQNSLVPKFQVIKLPSGGSGSTYAKVGMIDKGFILSYLWIPLLVFLILFIIYPYLTSRDANEKGITPLASELPSHFRAILLITLAYGLCKIMIAFKLSFTYPYFDKMTGIIPLSVSLMLLLVFNLSLMFNHAFVKSEVRKWRIWAALAVSVVCLAIIGVAFKMMDNGFNAETISSYYPSELGGCNFLRWSDAVGMNDTHRTVPFMLLLVNILTTIFLFVLTLIDIKKVSSKLNKFNGKINFWVSLIIGVLIVGNMTLIPGNFSTAAITLFAVMGLCWTLSKIDYTYTRQFTKSTPSEDKSLIARIKSFLRDNKSFWWTMMACFCYFVAATFPPHADKGYLTNFAGYMVFGIIVCLMVQKSRSQTETSNSEREWLDRYEKGIRNSIIFVLVVAIIFFIWGLPLIFKANSIDYDRSSRRFMAATQFEKFQDSGYRYAVSDAEFMIVMAHYMFNGDGTDPLSNTEHMLHPSLSTGQSPVILNDVSIQSSFFGTYGFWAFVVFFALLALLAWLVFTHTLTAKGELDMPRMWRLMAVLLWISTTVYLYVSYSGYIPFTGRLVPGFGVDAVGEALETSILLAFMTATTLHLSTTKKK